MVAIGIGRPADRRRIEVARTVPVPPADAWDLLVETRHWPAWGPPVAAVEPADERIESGTTGHVTTLGGLTVPFSVETCTERRWTWRAYGRRPPADGHRVEPLEDGRSRIVLELPLWAPWYVPLCLLALHNLVRLATSPDDATDEPP